MIINHVHNLCTAHASLATRVSLASTHITLLHPNSYEGSTINTTTTYLNHSHRQSRLFGQLLANVPRRFRCLAERRLKHLQLFGLYRRSGSASLRTVGAIVRALVLRLRIAAPVRIAVQGALAENMVVSSGDIVFTNVFGEDIFPIASRCSAPYYPTNIPAL